MNKKTILITGISLLALGVGTTVYLLVKNPGEVKYPTEYVVPGLKEKEQPALVTKLKEKAEDIAGKYEKYTQAIFPWQIFKQYKR